jgi:hypothetical protein
MSEWETWRSEGPSSYSEKSSYMRGTGGSETSKYPEEKKSKRDSLSSGERKGKSLNELNVRLQPLLSLGLGYIKCNCRSTRGTRKQAE